MPPHSTSHPPQHLTPSTAPHTFLPVAATQAEHGAPGQLPPGIAPCTSQPPRCRLAPPALCRLTEVQKGSDTYFQQLQETLRRLEEETHTRVQQVRAAGTSLLRVVLLV